MLLAYQKTNPPNLQKIHPPKDKQEREEVPMPLYNHVRLQALDALAKKEVRRKREEGQAKERSGREMPKAISDANHNAVKTANK